MEKNCLHEDDVGKKCLRSGDVYVKKIFAETYMFKKYVCGDVYV